MLYTCIEIIAFWNCTLQWGSGTWYPLDVAPGDKTEHIIAQASGIQVNVDQLDVGVTWLRIVVPRQVECRIDE